MKQRRVTIKQVAAAAGVSITTIPSVSVSLGDFFGVGHAVAKHYVSLPLNAIFGPRRGPKGPFAAAMNSYFTMPSGSVAKIQIRNESDMSIQSIDNYDASNQQFSWSGEGDDMFFRVRRTVPRHHPGQQRPGALRPVEHVPLPHRGPGALHHVPEGVDRARPRQRPGQRLLFRRYWYQTGKHADHAELPPMEDRLPRRWPEHGLWDE